MTTSKSMRCLILTGFVLACILRHEKVEGRVTYVNDDRQTAEFISPDTRSLKGSKSKSAKSKSGSKSKSESKSKSKSTNSKSKSGGRDGGSGGSGREGSYDGTYGQGPYGRSAFTPELCLDSISCPLSPAGRQGGSNAPIGGGCNVNDPEATECLSGFCDFDYPQENATASGTLPIGVEINGTLGTCFCQQCSAAGCGGCAYDIDSEEGFYCADPYGEEPCQDFPSGDVDKDGGCVNSFDCDSGCCRFHTIGFVCEPRSFALSQSLCVGDPGFDYNEPLMLEKFPHCTSVQGCCDGGPRNPFHQDVYDAECLDP